MSIETFSPLPLNIFSTWVTLLDPSDVPPGMSPNLADVEFFPEGCARARASSRNIRRSRGTPQVNGVKTYITPNLVQRTLVLDSLGNLYKETSPGVLSLWSRSAHQAEPLLASTTHFGREYMAFGDGLVGQDLPRQYDDSFFDRVSQIGPGRRASGGGFRHGGQHLAGRASVRP